MSTIPSKRAATMIRASGLLFLAAALFGCAQGHVDKGRWFCETAACDAMVYDGKEDGWIPPPIALKPMQRCTSSYMATGVCARYERVWPLKEGPTP